ncbi:MAG: hypothetical protein KDA88_12570 [Planctomycetaceae bacterium]|nr:hypothetical protein [Planctomycetaceae bacterium]MCA9033340.1 hypothetical protein [Planctomycetaceae bacterium]MCB9950207.1 hypothetical protein [Planctomycetaceae bacterium]
MQFSFRVLVVVGLISALAFTATRADNGERNFTGNSYHLYTAAFKPTDAGVVSVPSRYKWSVATSWRGTDAQGNNLPDTRIMLRLYDPDHNFTALTAQMDLETADKLQKDLAHIVARKRLDPDFQHRPKLYDSSLIPTGRFKGVNENGEAIIELEYK